MSAEETPGEKSLDAREPDERAPGETAPDGSGPLIRVVRGDPTDEELAAVVAVLVATGGSAGPASAPPPPASGWSAYWRSVGAPLLPGPGAWRASGRLG